VTVAAYVVLVVVCTALLCGHQGVTLPLSQRGAWRGLCARLAALRTPQAPRIHPDPERARDARTAAPLWACTQLITYEDTP
jgi:hypothetical protein